MSTTQAAPTGPAAVAVGANVRAEMARRGISQAALADHLGLTQASISKRLTGRVAFDVNELTRTAEFLDVHITAFLPAA